MAAAVDGQQVGDARLVLRVEADLGLAVGDRPLELLLDDLGGVHEEDAASGSDLLILLEGSQAHHPGAHLGDEGLGRVKVSLYTPLKRWATSRHSSTCCFWS